MARRWPHAHALPWLTVREPTSARDAAEMRSIDFCSISAQQCPPRAPDTPMRRSSSRILPGRRAARAGIDYFRAYRRIGIGRHAYAAAIDEFRLTHFYMTMRIFPIANAT